MDRIKLVVSVIQLNTEHHFKKYFIFYDVCAHMTMPLSSEKDNSCYLDKDYVWKKYETYCIEIFFDIKKINLNFILIMPILYNILVRAIL